MSGFVDWDDVVRRCAAAQKHISESFVDALTLDGSSDDGSDDDLSSCATISDVSSECPPLTPIPPPPLSIPLTGMKKLMADTDSRSHHSAEPSSRCHQACESRTASATHVGLLLSSLRRLDGVRAQRTAVAARTAAAHTHLAHQSGLLSDLQHCEGFFSARGEADNMHVEGEKDKVARKGRERLVRQLRELNRGSDALRRRLNRLQLQRLRAAKVCEPLSRRAVADADVRSLSPVCVAARRTAGQRERAQLIKTPGLSAALARGRHAAVAQLCNGDLRRGEGLADSWCGTSSPTMVFL